MNQISDTLQAEAFLSQINGSKVIDQHGRVFDYIRIAVNERCNLRCVYCLPENGIKFQPNEKLLTVDEINRIIHILTQHGVNKVRFTGGEPLLHKDIVQLVSNAANTPGIQSVHLTTNGIFLNKKAKLLYDAGLYGINISLDTLDHQKFIQIARREGLNQVLDSLSQVLEFPFRSVKINMVVMRDINHTEIKDFVELTKNNRLTIRFIELMPFDAHQIWKTGKFWGAEKIVEVLKALYPDATPGEGTKTEYAVFQVPGYKGKFAVIPSFTRSLCGECNRIRLTADGKIRNCLYSNHEFNLKSLLQREASDEDIIAIFKKAMWAKTKDGWEAQRQSPPQRESMSLIGG